jgi:hypothetical protein
MYEVLRQFDAVDYRSLLRAWGELRDEVKLIPDDRGRYRVA